MRKTWLTAVTLLFVACPAYAESLRIYPDTPTKSIVLTFDDGPRCGLLPELLEFLRKENIKAAFFVQGWQVKECPELLRRAVKEGHSIENHTYGHGSLSETVKRKGKDGAFKDIEDGSQAIQKAVGMRPHFFRPPHWVIGEREKTAWNHDKYGGGFCGVFQDDTVYKEELLCRGYLVQVLDDAKLPVEFRRVRDVNTLDYEFHAWYQKDPTTATRALILSVENTLKAREKSGVLTHVLTFHELPVSIAALRALIPEWRQGGYTFSTLGRIYGCEEARKC